MVSVVPEVPAGDRGARHLVRSFGLPGGGAIPSGLTGPAEELAGLPHRGKLGYLDGRLAMIQLTEGNLLEAGTEALVNTINTIGVMGLRDARHLVGEEATGG